MLPERPQQHSREVPHQMHPKLSSQNTWHPPVTLPEPPKTWFNPLGPSHHRPWGGVTQYYRHQLLDASLPLCPPPDRPRGGKSPPRQQVEAGKGRKINYSDFSGLPARCSICRSREVSQHLPGCQDGWDAGGPLGWGQMWCPWPIQTQP